MHFGDYLFQCRFDQEAQLPVYKGSTFRGGFGQALKQVVCALKHQDCVACLLKQQCLYPSVFEPHLNAGTDGEHNSNAPHPYVIQPPKATQTHYPQGTAFDFSLLLFGPVNTRLAYFVYALDQMGRIGLGKKIDGRRGTYTLEGVQSSGTTIYTHTAQAPPYGSALYSRLFPQRQVTLSDGVGQRPGGQRG